MSNKKISLLIVDDHTVVRQGLRALLSQEEDMEVIGEAANGRQAVQMVAASTPDVVIMDVMMPLMNGLEGTRQIIKNFPSAKVLVLTSYSDDDYVQQLTESGASGYLIKQTAGDDLVQAIREVQKGNVFFSPAVAKRFRDQLHQAFAEGQPVKREAELTSREAEVLQLIAEGLANKQIAGELGISIKTVEKHRQQVMNKLRIHDVAGLTRYAIAKGVVNRDMATKLDGSAPVRATGKEQATKARPRPAN
ncbi:MAG TPA: response regulator transcription factor [Verrucomicrobiae bacterium]|jgi:DNA-binding NarL/FixJ family response regulator|nr:response regulator transcription factor [Verrucomicrobiae bacterium]